MTATSHEMDVDIKRWQMLSIVVGVIGSAACLVGSLYEPGLVIRSYLAAFVFWAGLALGALGVLMMQYVTGGRWGRILLQALTSAALTLPLLAILFIPIAIGTSLIYPWTD